ncbi:hypothetical protein FHX44_11842 [Pseudonocardia hierapolitana]|uniref:Peptide subunit release factor 1 (ERF1) n=1 Tax=Pseudonocardia hierapolitana TaxID=1128676 RepID=A0A561SJ92_9PSEU|nr:hypothetical protein [Pseudonocardia hierapolitana]TWF74958.1 hypothetical protein FHX44_11842 [Pseudonocardia hierapolitana]
MDLLTRADLDLLADRGRPESHLSLFIPTHPFGAGTATDPIRWKNMVSRVQGVLAEEGMRAAEIAELLAPAWELRDDHRAWQYMSDGLAMFLRPGWHRMFRVPAGVPEVATIGDRFVVGPLLRIVTGDGHFLLLALSQRRLRLLEGSLQRVEELELADVPTSLRDVVERPEPRSQAMAFPVAPGRRAGSAVFYGTADDDVKKDEVRRYLRRVADGVRDYLTGQDLPMVLVGLDELISVYRDVNGYPHVTEDAVRRNPDQLSGEELHAAAWPIVEAIMSRERAAAIARFEGLHGTGLASNDPAKIEESARHGRVETLFLAAEPWCWEQLTDRTAVVRLGIDEAFGHCELLDRAAVDTLSGRGHVYAVPEAEVPGGGDVAAIFRY